MWIVSILFISLLSASTSQSIAPKDNFANEDSFSPYFNEDLEAEASDGEYAGNPNPSDVAVAGATVTYDKREYLGDMLRDYYSRTPEPSFDDRVEQPPRYNPKTNSSKPNMGGYGKIDISIQYGCCADQQSYNPSEPPPPNLEGGEPQAEPQDPFTRGAAGYEMDKYDVRGDTQEEPQKPQEPSYQPSPDDKSQMQQVGQIVIQKEVAPDSTSRFHDPSEVFGDNRKYMHGYQPNMYRSTDYRNYADDNMNDGSVSMKPMTTMNPAKSYNNNRYNSHHYEEESTSTPKSTTPAYKQELYRTFEPVLVAQEQFYTLQNPGFMSTMSPLTERRSYFTSERVLPPMNLYGGYMTTQPTPMGYYQRGGPPKTPPPTTQVSTTDRTTTTTPSYSYYSNHITPRSLLQDISKIVIQDVPSRLLYSGQQANEPQKRGLTFTMPTQQQAPKEQIPENNNRNYYQKRENNYQPAQNNYQPPSDTYQSQQNYQPDQNNYQQSQNSYQQPQNKYQPFENSYQSSQNQFSSNQNEPQSNNNNYKPGVMYYDSEPKKFEPVGQNNPTTDQFPSESNESDNLIKKNRQTFLKMQRQVYDLFTKGALNDFQTLLASSIKIKHIEIPLEEKNMLNTQIQLNEELNASILDYLTVYERHSEKLNDTDLANHLLQDMDRAKEYLCMKLNKFWLELDSMHNPTEFQEKKNYYKNREKPTGIMNIFYDWYEKLVNNSGQIDANTIQQKLVEIMKRERRYWLLLLKS